MASKHSRTVLGIRLSGAQRVRPCLKWASAHFPQEKKQILLSHHHLPDILMQRAACPAISLLCVRDHGVQLLLHFL